MKERFSVTVTDEELADFSNSEYYSVTVTGNFLWLLFSHFVLELGGQLIVQITQS